MELVLALEIDRKRNAIKVLSVKHSMMSQLLLISLVHAFSSFSGLIFCLYICLCKLFCLQMVSNLKRNHLKLGLVMFPSTHLPPWPITHEEHSTMLPSATVSNYLMSHSHV